MKEKIKVALIMNIPFYYSMGYDIPISLLYLGAELSKQGHDVKVIDRRTFKTKSNFIDTIKEYNADLIGISLFASDYTITYELINQIRRFSPSVKIIIGGPEVSAVREDVLNVFKDKADYLLSGESEYTLGELVNCLANRDEKTLKSIKGLSYWEDEKPVHNDFPDPIKDIDNIAFPKRDLIGPAIWKKWYFRAGLGRPTDLIFTSRGCPFSCSFCFRLIPGYRARSPENVLAEMEEIAKNGAKGLIIEDDNFTINRKRCIEILEGILKKGWKFNIKCRGRVNSVDPEMLKLMKKAGVKGMTFGIESGSQKVLDAMNKKATVEQNYETIRMVKEAGLQVYADMFIGYPGETPETIKETSDFLLKAKPTGINFGYFYPLHGTDVFEQVKNDGTLVGDWGLLQEYPWVRLPWFNDISELRNIWHKMSRSYWLNPGIIFNALKANILHFTPNDYITITRALWRRYRI